MLAKTNGGGSGSRREQREHQGKTHAPNLGRPDDLVKHYPFEQVLVGKEHGGRMKGNGARVAILPRRTQGQFGMRTGGIRKPITRVSGHCLDGALFDRRPIFQFSKCEIKRQA